MNLYRGGQNEKNDTILTRGYQLNMANMHKLPCLSGITNRHLFLAQVIALIGTIS